MSAFERLTQARTLEDSADPGVRAGELAKIDEQLRGRRRDLWQAMGVKVAPETIGFDALDAQPRENAVGIDQLRHELVDQRALVRAQPAEPFRRIAMLRAFRDVDQEPRHRRGGPKHQHEAVLDAEQVMAALLREVGPQFLPRVAARLEVEF